MTNAAVAQAGNDGTNPDLGLLGEGGWPMISSPSVETVVPRGAPERLNVPRRISRFALEQRSRLFDEDHDGVRRLMWAILKDTLRCYQNHFDGMSVHSQRLFRDASRWIHSNDLTWVFSFENVCLVLGIDGDRLRSELARWSRLRRRASAPYQE